MSQDIFLKINGIEGESLDSAHKNEIEVLAFNWRVLQESTMHAGSGGGAGKATVEDLEFDHYVDRSSPNLMKYCLTGKHVAEAKLTVRKAGGSPLEYGCCRHVGQGREVGGVMIRGAMNSIPARAGDPGATERFGLKRWASGCYFCESQRRPMGRTASKRVWAISPP